MNSQPLNSQAVNEGRTFLLQDTVFVGLLCFVILALGLKPLAVITHH